MKATVIKVTDSVKSFVPYKIRLEIKVETLEDNNQLSSLIVGELSNKKWDREHKRYLDFNASCGNPLSRILSTFLEDAKKISRGINKELSKATEDRTGTTYELPPEALEPDRDDI